MNKIGILTCFWTKNWVADIPAFILKVAKMGFDVLECPADLLLMASKDERKEIKNIAEDSNVEITFSTALPAEYDISSADNTVRRNGIEYLKNNMHMIHEMKMSGFGGVSYGQWQTSMELGEDDKQPYIERSVESLKEIMKTAQDCNVTYCVEVVNRFEQFMINTAAEAVAFVDMVGSPNLKILLDTFHMNIEEDSFRDAIITAGDKLGHVHVCENNRKLPGQGHIPWDEVAGALREVNYQGRLVIESFIQKGGEVGKALFIWRDSIPADIDAAVSESLGFLKRKFA